MLTPTMKTMLNTIVANENRLAVVLMHEMNYACTSGFNGFKRFFRYRAMDRQRHAIMLCNFVSDYVVEELDLEVAVPAILPSSGLLSSLSNYKEESYNQIDRIKLACGTALTDGEILLMGYLNKMIEDQSEELMRVKRLIVDLGMPEMDIRCFDRELHCKYKEMEKEKFGFQSPKMY